MNKTSSITKPIVIDLSRFTNWINAKEELLTLIKRSHSFWGSTPLTLRFADFNFTPEDVGSLKEIISESELSIYSIQTNSKTSVHLLNENDLKAESIPITKAKSQGNIRLIKEPINVHVQAQPAVETVLPPSSIIKSTAFVGTQESTALRAGSLVSYDGNVVIMGDVNPGCQLRATGSIIVYGKLCGSVHAGFGISNDEELEGVVVKALKMGEPLQISIGEYSACSSNESNIYSKQKIYPETARVIDGRIWRVSDFD